MNAWEMGWILHDAWDIDSLAVRWVWRLAAESGPRDSSAKCVLWHGLRMDER
jgi:hypothetical protein